MKKLFGLAVAVVAVVAVGVVALSAASVYADGGGCCSGMSKSSAKGGCCSDTLSKLNLTPEQKAKVESLRADTRRATSTSEMHQMFSSRAGKDFDARPVGATGRRSVRRPRRVAAGARS